MPRHIRSSGSRLHRALDEIFSGSCRKDHRHCIARRFHRHDTAQPFQRTLHAGLHPEHRRDPAYLERWALAIGRPESARTPIAVSLRLARVQEPSRIPSDFPGTSKTAYRASRPSIERWRVRRKSSPIGRRTQLPGRAAPRSSPKTPCSRSAADRARLALALASRAGRVIGH